MQQIGLFLLILVLAVMQMYYLQKEYNPRKVRCFSGISALIVLVLAAVLLFVYQQNYLEICKRVILMMLLFTAALSDYKKMKIPNKVILFGAGLRLAIYPIEFFTRRTVFLEILKSDFIGLGIMLLFFLTAYFIVKNGVGMGDIKMVLMMSLFLGTQGVFGALFLSLIVIFILSVILLVTKKKKKKDAIPFAPAVLFGTLVSILINGM